MDFGQLLGVTLVCFTQSTFITLGNGLESLRLDYFMLLGKCIERGIVKTIDLGKNNIKTGEVIR